jgi:hypothetical protein
VHWAERTHTLIVNARLADLALPESDRHRLYAGHWTPYGAAVTAQLLTERIAAASPPPHSQDHEGATPFVTLPD